ncbi:MAG: coproporphyrinogen-III oxidase family protein [Cellulosilyticaceae bacterium]
MFGERLKTHHSAMAESRQYARGPRNVAGFLNQTKPSVSIKDKGTIYIHVPFCSKICSFCNMRRSLQQPKEHYHELILEEMKAYSQLQYVKGLTFEAIYFGGGTPTTLSVEGLRTILRGLKTWFNLSEDVEITIETTVTELTSEKLEMFKAEGVNRFSVGIQTFNNVGRQQMGRVGSGEIAYEKLKEIKEMGFQTVSMDLIYNYPGQTVEDLEEDLEKISVLGLDGFSMYSLINMKETSIEHAQAIEQDALFFETITKKMEDRGYHFLELTKMVSKDTYKYVMNRHEGADTLPLGAGAGGSLGNLMLMNPIQLDAYETAVETFTTREGMLFSEDYTEIAKFKGSIQKARLPENVSLYEVKEAYEDCLEKLIEEGYVKKTEQGYQFTAKGVFWGNNISRLLDDLRKK